MLAVASASRTGEAEPGVALQRGGEDADEIGAPLAALRRERLVAQAEQVERAHQCGMLGGRPQDGLDEPAQPRPRLGPVCRHGHERRLRRFSRTRARAASSAARLSRKGR
ncbi:hypothetical protein [Vulcanimicrobium alpinum]|uniref:hypothetical protein n=1 Tax=Vulcanimicrobium alpinum TaxID=3016050 RepID=UPI00295E70DB|nr:hypothetical protein [Vulcanimicrobium alpinum]